MKPVYPQCMSALRKTAVLFFFLLFVSCSNDDDAGPGPDPDPDPDPVATELVSGAAINSANGLDIGADGNLYIASVQGQEIVVMDKVTGEILDLITEGVQSPDDLVFGPDGSLYWTDILTGEVGRRAPDGTVTKQAFLPGVNPITFNDEGRLFVALDFLGDGFYEFDPELVDPPRPIIESSEANPFPLGFFNAFDFGPDGRLYGPLFAANLIIAIDVGDPGDPPYTGTFEELVGSGDIEILAGLGGEFGNPASAKFGPDGLLWILDQTSKLFTLDISSGTLTVINDALDPGLDNMTFDTDGSLYMTSADEGWVAEILEGGQPRFISPGGMIMPQGIAVLEGSNGVDVIYEADLFRLREFDGDTGEQTAQFKGFLVPIPGQENLTLPMNVSASGNDLIISSFFNSEVQIWNPQSGVLETISEQVAAPIDAVRLDNGELIVSDLGLGGVVRLSDNSIIVALQAASGLATDGESVWAADWATGTVTQIDFDGGAPIANPVVSDLTFPEGIAIDSEGRLLVYETNGPVPGAESKLSRIDLSTGEKTTIVEDLDPKQGGLPGFPPMWFFDGIAVGPSGAIYIRTGESNAILKVE